MPAKRELKPRGRPPIPQIPASFEELLGAIVQPARKEGK